jgi:hypothetical protein
MAREHEPPPASEEQPPPISDEPFDGASELEPGPPVAEEPAPGPTPMIPVRGRRRTRIERVFVRLVATGGIVGIAVVLGAILVHQTVAGWIVGLVIGVVTVVLAALLWSSHEL